MAASVIDPIDFADVEVCGTHLTIVQLHHGTIVVAVYWHSMAQSHQYEVVIKRILDEKYIMFCILDLNVLGLTIFILILTKLNLRPQFTDLG